MMIMKWSSQVTWSPSWPLMPTPMWAVLIMETSLAPSPMASVTASLYFLTRSTTMAFWSGVTRQQITALPVAVASTYNNEIIAISWSKQQTNTSTRETELEEPYIASRCPGRSSPVWAGGRGPENGRWWPGRSPCCSRRRWAPWRPCPRCPRPDWTSIRGHCGHQRHQIQFHMEWNGGWDGTWCHWWRCGFDSLCSRGASRDTWAIAVPLPLPIGHRRWRCRPCRPSATGTSSRCWSPSLQSPSTIYCLCQPLVMGLI